MSHSSKKAELSEQMKTAMKSGDKQTLMFARNLHAAVRKKEIDDQIELDDAGWTKIISLLIKQRRDSIEQFKQGGREDLVEKETQELEFLQKWLPHALISSEELAQLVDWAVTETHATSLQDLGKVMKLLLSKTKDRADGRLMQELVRKRIGIHEG